MKLNQFHSLLENGKTVYLLDDFEGAVFRIVPNEKGTGAYIKRKGKKEQPINQSENIVCEAILGGLEISKEQYECY